MTISRQDIGVLLFYILGYSRLRNFLLRVRRKPMTRFITFHDIEPSAVANFESNIVFLKQNLNVISFDDYMTGNLSTSKVNIVITFDDGFKSWVTHAVPILRKLSLPATFFISTGFVGLNKHETTSFLRSNLLLNESYQLTSSGGLSNDDIRNISDHGFTIGGHTLSHCDLSAFHDEAALRREIEKDKIFLKKKIKKKIHYFSYPFGFHNNPNIDIIKILQEVGYQGAVTTISGYNDKKTNAFLLRRNLTSAAMSSLVFKARIYGNYELVKLLKETFLKSY